jgi:hypothetical protein
MTSAAGTFRRWLHNSGGGEGGAYAALTSPGDDKATYAATKRGGLETVTREMILNDDVNAIRRIPAELALAAGNTLYEFVFDFFRTNPTVAPGALHASSNHRRVDATQFAAHRLARSCGGAPAVLRMGVSPATVLIPFELETAYNLFVRNQN